MNSSELLKVTDLKVRYSTPDGPVHAVDEVGFHVGEGEAFGLVGESGSGKTTLVMAILRLLPSTGRVITGTILYKGRDLLSLEEPEMRLIRWKQISLVFQGALAGLDPLWRVGDQIGEAIRCHLHYDKSLVNQRVAELLNAVGLSTDIRDDYPHELSGGMNQRVMIAMALACNPELIITDEPTSALDVVTSKRIVDLLKDLKRDNQCSHIVISHDLAVVGEISDKIGVMYAGKLVETLSAEKFSDNSLHPYTQALLAAYPSITGPKTYLKPIRGESPSLIDPPSGCKFNPRCPHAMPICSEQEPVAIDIAENHTVACFLYNC